MTAFWDIMAYNILEVDRRFRSKYYLHHHGDETKMVEAVSTSETLANFYETTRRYIPEDSHFRTRRRENLISCKFESIEQNITSPASREYLL
jgi:hypothetical protein